MRRIAYLWSEELMRVADSLPANQGRSRLVHGLIGALGLVDLDNVREYTSAPSLPDPSADDSETVNGEDIDGDDSPGPIPTHNDTDRLQAEAGDIATDEHQTMSNTNGTEEDGRTEVNGRIDHQATSKTVDVKVIAPDPILCEASELRRYHDASYVEYLLYGRGTDTDEEEEFAPRKRRRKDRSHKLGLEYDCPPFLELPRYAALVAGATLTACRMLARGEADIAVVWDGGRHHAGRAKASGFCYVADAVLGILLLCREGVPRPTPFPSPRSSSAPTPTRRARILYLDLDLHYGDGVARAFACPTHFSHPLRRKPRPPQVLTLSMHHVSPLFFPPGAPGTSEGDTPHPFNLSLGLAEHAGAATYARLWANVEKVYQAWGPDYVVLQLGVDGLPRDPIGQVGGWNTAGEGGIAWIVEQVLAWRVPVAVLGGGGYHHANAARAWATATSVLLGREMGPETDIPDAFEQVDAFAPGFTLEVEPSHVPDKTTREELEAADAAFDVIAGRIREIRALHE